MIAAHAQCPLSVISCHATQPEARLLYSRERTRLRSVRLDRPPFLIEHRRAIEAGAILMAQVEPVELGG
jgi:hypothetical protein